MGLGWAQGLGRWVVRVRVRPMVRACREGCERLECRRSLGHARDAHVDACDGEVARGSALDEIGDHLVRVRLRVRARVRG